MRIFFCKIRNSVCAKPVIRYEMPSKSISVQVFSPCVIRVSPISIEESFKAKANVYFIPRFSKRLRYSSDNAIPGRFTKRVFVVISVAHFLRFGQSGQLPVPPHLHSWRFSCSETSSTRVPSRRMAQQFDMASSSGIPAAINLRSSVIANLQKSGGEKKH